MAQLRIYNDILDEETANMMRLFGAGDAVSFVSVDDFINSIPEDDNEISLKINCRGGMIDEAWTMYDALRATGKEISAEVIGEASSSATILLCAAAKGRRTAHPNAKFLFHYPFIAGLGMPARANDLENIARDLSEEETRLLDLYVERTGCDREEMDALMREDRQVSAERAKELGFIDTILAPKSALNTKNKKHMTIREAFEALGAALGINKLAQDLETATGEILRLRKEEGEPRVGDEVDNADGEYVMPDGKTIVVEAGKIVEIREPQEKRVEVEIENVGGDPLEETTEEKDKEVGDLEAEVERLHREIAERDERIAELEAEVERLRNNAKNDDEVAILNAVNTLGGIDALRKIASKTDIEKRDFKGDEKPAKKSYKDYYNEKHNKLNK
jgi:ATP-dependent Clp protease protease subunit